MYIFSEHVCTILLFDITFWNGNKKDSSFQNSMCFPPYATDTPWYINFYTNPHQVQINRCKAWWNSWPSIPTSCNDFHINSSSSLWFVNRNAAFYRGKRWPSIPTSCNDFHITSSITLWFVNRNKVFYYRDAATHSVSPGEKRLPKSSGSSSCSKCRSNLLVSIN
jgi:hypothetical protein